VGIARGLKIWMGESRGKKTHTFTPFSDILFDRFISERLRASKSCGRGFSLRRNSLRCSRSSGEPAQVHTREKRERENEREKE
jgi:hypothetical protein